MHCIVPGPLPASMMPIRPDCVIGDEAVCITGIPARIFNSSPPGQNGRHFTDDIFKCIFVNEKNYILIKISLKCAPKGPIDNNPALV